MCRRIASHILMKGRGSDCWTPSPEFCENTGCPLLSPELPRHRSLGLMNSKCVPGPHEQQVRGPTRISERHIYTFLEHEQGTVYSVARPDHIIYRIHIARQSNV